MRALLVFTLFTAGFACPASAHDRVTVESLLKRDFEIKGVLPTPQVPIGLVLEDDDEAFMCVVAETPTSSEVATQYCKPIR